MMSPCERTGKYWLSPPVNHNPATLPLAGSLFPFGALHGTAGTLKSKRQQDHPRGSCSIKNLSRTRVRKPYRAFPAIPMEMLLYNASDMLLNGNHGFEE